MSQELGSLEANVSTARAQTLVAMGDGCVGAGRTRLARRSVTSDAWARRSKMGARRCERGVQEPTRGEELGSALGEPDRAL